MEKITSKNEFVKFCEAHVVENLDNAKVGDCLVYRDSYWGDRYQFLNKDGLDFRIRKQNGERLEFPTCIDGAEFSLKWSEYAGDRPIRLNINVYSREGEVDEEYVSAFFATVEEAYRRGLEGVYHKEDLLH